MSNQFLSIADYRLARGIHAVDKLSAIFAEGTMRAAAHLMKSRGLVDVVDVVDVEWGLKRAYTAHAAEIWDDWKACVEAGADETAVVALLNRQCWDLADEGLRVAQGW